MNTRLLKSYMVRFGDNGLQLSNALGIARSSLSDKMNGTNGREFTQGEILLIKDRYNLTANEIEAIFFAKEVS